MQSQRWLPAVLVVCLSLAGCRSTERFGLDGSELYRPAAAQAEDGHWQVTGDGYTAEVNGDGYLASFKVGAVETIGAPFAYQPEAKLAADSAEMTGDTLNVHLKGPGGEATIDYRFRRDGLAIIPVWHGQGSARFQFTAAPAVLGIELLSNVPVTTAEGGMHLVEQGETRGVPAIEAACGRAVRFYFPGLALHVDGQSWGDAYGAAPGYEIRDRSWGRAQLAAERPYPIVLTIQRGADKAWLPAPVFVPRTDKPGGLYRADEPYNWTLDFGTGESLRYLTEARIEVLAIDWRVSDACGRLVAMGLETVRLDPEQPRITKSVTVKAGDADYCHVHFKVFEPSGRMLPSSFRAWFRIARASPVATKPAPAPGPAAK